MSSQRVLQFRRFPMEAGDCAICAVRGCPVRCPRPHSALSRRQLQRCPGSHCLTLPHVPIDVFIAMGGRRRPRTS
uniref:Uncharacterized protein n=1 Tax=Melopsittacus undulatus TaxID=13146 RepID=A0A8C6IP40_MELUD